jgi:hypothetical protein
MLRVLRHQFVGAVAVGSSLMPSSDLQRNVQQHDEGMGGHDTRALQAYLCHRNIRHTASYRRRGQGLLAGVMRATEVRPFPSRLAQGVDLHNTEPT